MSDKDMVSDEAFRWSIERWLDGLTGEDKRLCDGFVTAFESRDHVVTRLFEVNRRHFNDMAETEDSVSFHLEKALEFEIATWLRPKTAAVAVYNHIVRGENPVLSHPRRAAEALGLDIQVLADRVVQTYNLTDSGLPEDE
jgi:hypothetical protein